MSSETTRPSDTIDAGDSVAVGGGGATDLDGVTADDVDATYFVVGADPATIAFDAPVAPGILYSDLILVCSAPAQPGNIVVGTNGAEPFVSRLQVTGLLHGGRFLPRPEGSRIPPEAWDLDDPRIIISADPVGLQVYELNLVFGSITPPVVTIAAPAGTIEETNRPEVTWNSVLDPDGGDRTHYEVKLYDGTTFGDFSGVDPDHDAALEQTGEVQGFAEAYQIDAVLPEDDYRAYVRVAQMYAAELIWSDWAFTDFAIDVDLPRIPDMTLEPDDDAGLIALDIASSNALTTAGVNLVTNASFEHDADDWSATDGATITWSTEDSGGGTHSLRLNTDGDTTQEYARTDPMAVDAGVDYIATAFVKAADGATMRIRISELDGSDVEIGSDQTEFTTNGEWAEVDVRHQMSDDAVTARVQIGSSSTAQVIVAWIDRVSFNPFGSDTSNSSFERDLEGWHDTGAGTVDRTRTDEESIDGDWSQKVVVDGSAGNQGAASDNFPLSPSQTHWYRVYVKGIAGAGLRVQLQERDSGGTLIGSGQQDFTASGDWQLIEVSRAFGATGVLATVNVKTDQTGEATTFYMDAAIVTEGPEFPTDEFQIQRSDDGGVTWADIRTPLGDGRVSLLSSVIDYEATNGGMVHYRARSVATPTASGKVYSPWAEAVDYWSSDDVWLKDPFQPWRSMKIQIVNNPTRRRSARVAEFQPMNRQCKITVSDKRGPAEGTITFNMFTEADQAALDVLLDSLAPLLLQTPAGWHWPDRWLIFKDHDRNRAVDKAWVEFTIDALPWLAVAPTR